MTKLSHVEISVGNYPESIRFYDRVLPFLGWKRLVCQKSHTTFSDGVMKLVFCPADHKYLTHGYHRKRVGLNHLALVAESKEQVDSFYELVLRRHGIACLYDGKPSGDSSYYAVYFEDPDRIKIEVVFAPGYCEPHHWTNQIADDFDPYKDAPTR